MPDFLDEIIAEGEARSPGFAEKVDAALARRRAMPPTEHPSDCQKCSEDADPCARHAEDWRYWQARALDAEEAAADVDDTHDDAAKEGEK